MHTQKLLLPGRGCSTFRVVKYSSSTICPSRVSLLRVKANGSGSGQAPDSEPSSSKGPGSSQQPETPALPASSPDVTASAAGGPNLEAQQQQQSALEASSQPELPAAASSTPITDATDSGAGPNANSSSSSSSSAGLQPSTGAGAAAVAGGGGAAGGPSAVTLLSRFNGVGYTFVLAGFLKIVTVGGLSLSAPTDVARTAFGKATPYLMVPVGLGLCWVAKQAVDTGLNESKRFLQYMVAVLVVLYFGLTGLMYKYEPQGERVRRPRPRMPGQMADLRAQLGDRELLAAGDMDSSRFYQADKPGSRELYDDVAWYEGRYPSQLVPPGQQQKRGPARSAALAVTDTEEEYSVAANLDVMQQRLGSSRTAEPTAAVKTPARRSYLSDSTR